MNHHILKSWEEFEERVAELTALQSSRQAAITSRVSPYLYRGHTDSAWPLATTLERYFHGTVSMEKYYRLAHQVLPRIETYTGVRWDGLPTVQEFREMLKVDPIPFLGEIPAYDYFVYLRHHGFPSPLLDWSESPFVAAYFAFRDLTSTAERVSVFAFCEYTQGFKSTAILSPRICGLHSNVRSHRRHFQQQSQYTYCTVPVDDATVYTSHELAFAETSDEQDELWKFEIPASERRKVLKRLAQFNINAFSLFGSEESLMETLFTAHSALLS